MKLFQLQYFCSVCKYKCVSKAAECLHVSQPSISVALKDLEAELDVSLFARSRNKLTLTTEGELFYLHAQQILSDLDKAIIAVQRMAQNKKNLIIGVPPMLASFTVHKLLRVKEKFERSNNNTTIQVMEIDALRIVRMLENGEIDLAILGLSGNNFLNTCGREILWKTSLLFCAHKSHPLAKKDLISINDIHNEPLITSYNREGLTHQLISDWFGKYGRTPNFKYSFSQTSTMVNLLCNNIGVTLIRSDMYIENSELTYVSLKDNIQVDVGVIWNISRPLSSSRTKVISMLKESFQEDEE
ncbi:LysR family transcriptional regulator [Petroclostridium sp. X23]|uniref:LysR family transcriptional regulator n=1 Tax=Petroclostridium sp. X23 TaxID=3045146 RepID=UPI0024AD57CF|nr:LysR family transcriptional regulator [Petroclostridium sp. X23]WHH60925.1 LysR family transcriptional regulator [Petroclostridium sp. X23]